MTKIVTNTSSKIVNQSQGKEQIQIWKKQGLEIIFTNGCFDIVHLGHVEYLEKARNMGDKLVLGLNSDESVSILKGADRPVNNLEARSRVLAAMEFINLVIPFFEDTPKNLIANILPNILVKGKDYEICNIVGADVVLKNGGRVETIDLVAGYSTSHLINKIKI